MNHLVMRCLSSHCWTLLLQVFVNACLLVLEVPSLAALCTGPITAGRARGAALLLTACRQPACQLQAHGKKEGFLQSGCHSSCLDCQNCVAVADHIAVAATNLVVKFTINAT
jgi:hypothetical protein